MTECQWACGPRASLTHCWLWSKNWKTVEQYLLTLRVSIACTQQCYSSVNIPVDKHMCASMHANFPTGSFIAALSIMASKWNPSKYPPTVKWVHPCRMAMRWNCTHQWQWMSCTKPQQHREWISQTLCGAKEARCDGEKMHAAYFHVYNIKLKRQMKLNYKT